MYFFLLKSIKGPILYLVFCHCLSHSQLIVPAQFRLAMITHYCLVLEEGLVDAEGEEREEGEKGKCKICLAGELNPGLQRERRDHRPLYQGGLIRISRNISLQTLCSSIFSILSPEMLLAIRH
jgi:hypothetical protein